jgi:hypothetical protein
MFSETSTSRNMMLIVTTMSRWNFNGFLSKKYSTWESSVICTLSTQPVHKFTCNILFQQPVSIVSVILRLCYVPFGQISVTVLGRCETVHSVRRPLIVQAQDDRLVSSIWWNENWQGKPKYSEECHFVHHKSHMTDLGSNPGRRGGKPATNRLSNGTASLY